LLKSNQIFSNKIFPRSCGCIPSSYTALIDRTHLA